MLNAMKSRYSSGKTFNELVFVIILSMVMTANPCFSQWYTTGVLNSPGFVPRIFVVDSNIVWAVGAYGIGPKVWRTVNGGNNWTVINTVGLPFFLDCVYAKDSLTAFVGDAGSSGGGGNAHLFRTTDGGVSWNLADSTGGVTGWISGIEFCKTNPNLGFAVSDPPEGPGYPFFLTRTTNGGQTWTHIFLPGVPASFFTAFDGSFYIDPLFYGFVITLDSFDSTLVYFTRNGGTNWVVTGPPSAVGTSFGSWCDFNDDKTLGIFINADFLPNIVKTTNGGVTWNIVNTTINGTGHSIIRWISGTNTVFVTAAAAPSGNVFRSDDNGLTWTAQSTSGVQNIRDASYARNGSVVYGFAIAGNGTVLKTRQIVVPIGIQPISNETPSKFTLYQNYPNPFNPVTKIKFDVPNSFPPLKGDRGMTVRLQIYDVLGREAAILINEHLQPGTYEVDWNAGNYSSGIYFYKLTAGEFTDSKKMTIIK